MTIFYQATLHTPIGSMMAIADENHLYCLDFIDNKTLSHKIVRLKHLAESDIIDKTTVIPLKSIESELAQYFAGTLKEFKTPVNLVGTEFQKQAWRSLCQIPYGETISYRHQALNIQRPLAHRAVANANSWNMMAIIIPCHRVIQSNGKIGGYSGGCERKGWLIHHEKNQPI